MDFKKDKKLFFIFIILVLLIGFLGVRRLLEPSALKQETIKINNSFIKVEIAASLRDQYQGLSGRQFLEVNAGMLFTYPDKQIREFVMRNMNFPLDILFISGDRIIKIAPNLKPESFSPQIVYRSDEPVDKVLELNGAYCEREQIKVGDRVLFNQ